ncbi:MAG TPA: NADPH:quinone reductase [Terrimicrobiaceae bacterium]|nr:NADPH:quinone reductase [Terrimicrobiaceae bacterium]
MKAIRVECFGEPEVMKLVEVPEPEVGEGQILVEVRAAGVNPVETYIRAGIYPRKPALPYTPGSDGAGVVMGVGPGGGSLQPGDRVFLSGSLTGTYAEVALCTPAQVHPLSERATFAQGAALGIPYATAYRGLFQRAQARHGETVLVHGASGGVGTAAIQLARGAGLRTLGTAGSPEGCRLVRELGGEQVFDHHDPGYRQAILDATEGRGVDCILEMLANVNLGEDLRLLAPRGRVVVIGSRGSVEINPRDAMMLDADIRGMVLPNTPHEELAAIYQSLGEALAAGDLQPVIGKEFPLAEAAEAHRAVMSPKAHGKIVLVP